MTRLCTEGLVAGYGDIRVIDGVDLEVTSGTMSAVVGPNGAGKSTLLKGILGLARVFAGEVKLNDQPVTNRPLEQLAKAGIAYVPQVDDVFDSLRVRENLEMGGYLLDRTTREERIEEVLEVFPDLKRKLRRFVGSMSGGERKMTAFGRALMLAPAVMVLDEPTAGLSPALTQVVLGEQARVLADRGKAVLLVEQKAKAALELADWAYVMVQGRIAMSASGRAVLEDPAMAEVFLGGGSASAAVPPIAL
ncbi:MAG: ABC transporter ATP-binding protein [Acidimicrobiales bacterium]